MESANVTQLPLQDRLWAWFDTNRKPVVWGAVGAVGIGIIVGFVTWHRGEKELEAGQALSNVLVSPMGGARPDVASAYLKVASEYSRTPAGAQALLLAAENLFDQAKYAEAQALFERFTREHQNSPLLGGALLGIAASLDAQGKANEAVAAYKAVVSRFPTDNVAAQAKFALGRLYEMQNSPDSARLAYNQYQEVERMVRYGSLGDEAAMRLKELETKYPSLAPAPVAPAGISSFPPVAPAPSLQKK